MNLRFDEARRRMVRDFIEGKGIQDQRVLQAMLHLERHRFVDGPIQAHAYEDRALPIGTGQTISQPWIVGKMTEALMLKGQERILEIGTGSGYQAAILSLLCNRVYTIERHEGLLKRARGVFQELGLTNILSHRGDGSIGWPSEAPFDGIIVTAGAPEVPRTLAMQLCIGGRLVIPVGDKRSQDLKIVVRTGEQEFQGASAGACSFVPLIGREGFSL